MLKTGAEFSLVAAERLSEAALAKMETAEAEGCRGAGGKMIKIEGQLIGDVRVNDMYLSHYGTKVPSSGRIGGPHDFGDGFPESTRKGYIWF